MLCQVSLTWSFGLVEQYWYDIGEAKMKITQDKRTPVFNLLRSREQLTADISTEQFN